MSRKQMLLKKTIVGVFLVALGIVFFINKNSWLAVCYALAMLMYFEVVIAVKGSYARMRITRLHMAILLLGISGFIAMAHLRQSKEGTALLIVGVVMVVFFDSCSQLVGMAIGKTKMAPRASPNKTWEGFAGGTIFSLLAGYGALRLVEAHHHEVTSIDRPVLWLSMLAIPPIAYAGDINASMLKRCLYSTKADYLSGVKRKDFSSLLGSHGGLADRFDAMTMTFATVGFLWLFLL